jgi:hypothetical protein
VNKEKKSNEVLGKILGLPEGDQLKYQIEDIYGNKLEGYFRWSFEVK